MPHTPKKVEESVRELFDQWWDQSNCLINGKPDKEEIWFIVQLIGSRMESAATARAREDAAKVAIGMMYEETSHDSISFSTGEKISSTEKIIFNNACIQIAAAIRSQDDREGKKE